MRDILWVSLVFDIPGMQMMGRVFAAEISHVGTEVVWILEHSASS